MRETVDIVVVGGGNAALCAAISAREAGASVVLLECATRAWRGGNSKYTRNVRCVTDTRVNGDSGYDHDEFAADLAGVTGDGGDPALTSMTIDRSRDVPAWMGRHGVRWQPALRGTLGLSRTNHFFLGGGKALMNVYYALAQDLGIEIAYEHAVCELHFDGDRCREVVVQTPDGQTTVRPRAVVVASGGFEANLAWLAEYWGEAAANYMVRGTRHNDGSVLRSLLAGGARARGNPRGFHAIAVDARGPAFEGGIATRVDSVPFSIMVNRDGQRFADEGEDMWAKRYASWGGRIAGQPEQIAYSIFDAKIVGTFMATAYRPHRADSIGELAALIDVPAPALVETVHRYNAAVVSGTPDRTRLDDCRTEGLNPAKSHWAVRVEEPPFYAYPLRTGITFTYLGVAVDERAAVLRDEGGAFANVFAAGEVMAGNILQRGYLAGFGMTIGTVFGRIAGEEAASVAQC